MTDTNTNPTTPPSRAWWRQLDYSLPYDHQRQTYIDDLLSQPLSEKPNSPTLAHHLANTMEQKSTQYLLEQYSNYILFGKKEDTKLNLDQEGAIVLPTKHSTFAASSREESLDQLLEQRAGANYAPLLVEERNRYLLTEPPIARPTWGRVKEASPPLPTPNTPTKLIERMPDQRTTLLTQPSPQPHSPLSPYTPTDPTLVSPAPAHPRTTPLPPPSTPIYTIVDPGDSTIPGMVELWESIDYLERRYQLARGRVEPEPNEEVPFYTPLEQYYLRHWIVELRQRQYALRDAYRPRIPHVPMRFSHSSIDWTADSGYWLDETQLIPTERQSKRKMRQRLTPDGATQYFRIVRQHTLDLTNPKHVYHLLEHYDRLWKDSWDDLTGQMKFILLDLDEVGRRTPLNPIYSRILDLKVAKTTNARVRELIQEEFGTTYDLNYISVIYKQKICKKIADTALLLEKERKASLGVDGAPTWKLCSTCRERKLAITHNFARRAASSDGLSPRCKACDKEAYQRRKEGGRT